MVCCRGKGRDDARNQGQRRLNVSKADILEAARTGERQDWDTVDAVCGRRCVAEGGRLPLPPDGMDGPVSIDLPWTWALGSSTSVRTSLTTASTTFNLVSNVRALTPSSGFNTRLFLSTSLPLCAEKMAHFYGNSPLTDSPQVSSCRLSSLWPFVMFLLRPHV